MTWNLSSERKKGILRVAGLFLVEELLERLAHSTEIGKAGMKGVDANQVGSFRRGGGAASTLDAPVFAGTEGL